MLPSSEISPTTSRKLRTDLFTCTPCPTTVGAIVVWLHYLPHWGETEDPGLKLASFSTGPAIRKPVANFITEVIGTAMLLMGVLAMLFAFDMWVA